MFRELFRKKNDNSVVHKDHGIEPISSIKSDKDNQVLITQAKKEKDKRNKNDI